MPLFFKSTAPGPGIEATNPGLAILPGGDTGALAALIGQKRSILGQLRRLASEQLDVIAQGSLPQLMSLLGTKQTLLVELQAVDRELDPFRKQDPDARAWRDAASRDRCRREAAECESLLRDILHLEQQGERELAGRRDRAADQLSALPSLAEAHAAYAQGESERRESLDLSSEIQGGRS